MIKKFKTILFSLIPIIVFVLAIHFFVMRVETEVFLNFFIGCILLIVGQVVFLTGIEKSIEPMGQFVGSSATSNKHFFVFIIFGLVFGLFSTVAEPDMQVFSSKVVLAGFQIPKIVFLLVAGLGVGVFISLALMRLAAKFSLNITLFVAYLIVFVLAYFAGESSFSMSLDAGTSTTGVVTSPFLLALGVGVAGITASSGVKDEDNFGFIALSSVGPIISILILTLFTNEGGAEVGQVSTSPLWLETLKDVSLSIIPLVVIFFVFEALFIKISKQEKKKLIMGSLITFVGFYLFLFGINFGLSAMGELIGKILVELDSSILLILVCAILGFLIVFSEPSIRILANQIEEVTNRNIKAPLVVTAIAISVMISMALCVIRILYDFSIWWYAGVIFGLSFVLMLFCPKLFVAIAFDSAGVATGTMTVAFLFPIMSGVAGSLMGSFGVMAVLCMMPILVMEILGVVYKLVVDADGKRKTKNMLKLSNIEDKFSNITKLKENHNKFGW